VHSGLAAHAPAPRCVVCQAVLSRRFGPDTRAPDPYPSCHAVACRMVVSRREEMGDAGFRHHLQLHARHTQHLAATAQATLQRKHADAEENAKGWASLRARLDVALTVEPLQLLLPSGPRRSRRLVASRRERYRAHLLKMIADAHATDPPGSPLAEIATATAAGVASTLPGRLCALCGGGCCTHGADHAYLSGDTLRRFMDAHPALTDAQVLAAYLDRMGVKSQANSCINHSTQGCSLPKEMRSDICNRFSCESLARLQATQREGVAVQVVLILQRKQDHWRRADPGLDNSVTAHALLGETGVRRFLR